MYIEEKDKEVLAGDIGEDGVMLILAPALVF